MNVAIDLSGGRGGGAGRFRAEFFRFANERAMGDVDTLGETRSVTAVWLARRELHARGYQKLIAANNVSFLAPGRDRWVLLRNANHFLTRAEWATSGQFLGRTFSAQVWHVRQAARRANRIVVPSTSMADRVTSIIPSVSDRISIRFHPLTVRSLPGREFGGRRQPRIICPIVAAPFKTMGVHLIKLQEALPKGLDLSVLATVDEALVPQQLARDSRFVFTGLLDRERLQVEYDASTAVYYPTSIESFGYPLAEARSVGIPVIAANSRHNHEVAGDALVPYQSDSILSLRMAVTDALSKGVDPDPAPFDRDAYFEWLLWA